jgi:hypothetical protein
MKPEAVVLQKPMDPAQATLANGVYCGSAFQRLTSGPSWSSAVAFTNYLGYDTPGEMDVGFPGTEKTILTSSGQAFWEAPPGTRDAATRMPGSATSLPIDDALGRSILAVKINDDQGLAAVLIDRGPDDDNSGAQDCEVMIGAVADVLTPDLIAALRFKAYIRGGYRGTP